jgi:hypothetical protein
MEENQSIDGTTGRPSDKPEREHSEDREWSDEDQHLKDIVFNFIELTSYIQGALTEDIRSSGEMSEELKKIDTASDNRGYEIIEKEIKRFISLIPLADAMHVNLVTSLVGTISDIIGLVSVTEAIEEFNKKTINQ